MDVYCDAPGPALWVRLARALARGAIARGAMLEVLDEPRRGVGERISLFVLVRALGLRVRHLSFSAADMLTRDGAALRPVARRLAFRFALAGARAVLQRSRRLSRINQAWSRDTVALHVANGMWLEAERVFLRILVTDALRRDRGTSGVILYLRAPEGFVILPDATIAPGVDVRWYHASRSWSRTRLGAIAWLARDALHAWRRLSTATALKRERQPSEPALLVPQEDEISLDHSYRAQPHWLVPGEGPPPFRTLVLAHASMPSPEHRATLQAHGVEAIGPDAVHGTPRRHLPSVVRRRLASDARNALAVALFAPSHQTVAAAVTTCKLLAEATSVGALCAKRNVRAFMTCENYMLPAAAARLVAPALGVQTIGYQYSNLASQSLVLLTNSDIMATFAPHFHDRFVLDGIAPGRFVDVGYPFTGREALIGGRAAAQRAELLRAGATFVVGFFDESSGQDRFGIFNQEKYEASLLELVRFTLSDRTVGLVFKPQFHRNLAGATPRLRKALSDVERTGRFLMPSHGRTRNTVLPSEVAMMSDIVIGHRIGATASLEAALAGARSLLIDLKGFRSGSDSLYSRCDIVYASMEAALSAVVRFRDGDPALRALGDWTPILSEFDPFRDGRAGSRLRAVIEGALGGGPRNLGSQARTG